MKDFEIKEYRGAALWMATIRERLIIWKARRRYRVKMLGYTLQKLER